MGVLSKTRSTNVKFKLNCKENFQISFSTLRLLVLVFIVSFLYLSVDYLPLRFMV